MIQKGFHIDFLNGEPSTDSFRPGETVEIELSFRNEGPGAPDRNYSVELCLADEYGRELKCQTAAFDEPATDWKAGETREAFIAIENPPGPDAQQNGLGTPGVPIEEGMHSFLFSLIDPDSGARLVLEDGRQPFHQRQRYEAARAHVAGADSPILQPAPDAEANAETLWRFADAPKVETRDGKLFLNGQPFIVKGQNVHDLSPYSRSQTRETMRILKESGHNLLRADHPLFWQVKLAREMGLFYMPLAPFSVMHTSALDAQCLNCDALELAAALTREFVAMYRDFDNVLLWNSANEVKGDTDALLETVYPIYKKDDPYGRPVVYSNLGAQFATAGQDILGFNFYVKVGERPEDHTKIFDKYAKLAADLGKPVIFTELNAWGEVPDQQAGVDVYETLWPHALDAGLSGGVFYQATDSPEGVPGIVDSAAANNIHQPLYRAGRRAFEDLVLIESRFEPPAALILTLANRRPYPVAIRKASVLNKNEPAELGIATTEITSQTTSDIPIRIGDSSHGLLEIQLELVSHFGLISKEIIDIPIEY